jgi:DNA-binding IclR family transcriptional regulator
MAPDEAETLLPALLERFTEFTITDRARLLAEIELARATGLAYDRQEHTLAISAIGMLVRDVAGPSAAITIVMPSIRFEEDESAVKAALLRARGELSGA